MIIQVLFVSGECAGTQYFFDRRETVEASFRITWSRTEPKPALDWDAGKARLGDEVIAELTEHFQPAVLTAPTHF